jgi:hypothetical protein
MTLDNLVEDNHLGPFDYNDQQVVGRELVIVNMENAIQLFLQFFDEEELNQFVNPV